MTSTEPEATVPEPTDPQATSASEATPAVVGPPRPQRRGRLARVASAIGVLALTAAAVAVGIAVPPPGDVAAQPLTIEVPPAAQTLVCPGALTQPGGGGVGDSAFDPTPVDTLTEVRGLSIAGGEAVRGDASDDPAPSGALLPLAGGEPLGTLAPAAGAAKALRVDGFAGATVLRAEPAGDLPPRAAAASASITAAGDLRGLAAASCQVPAADQWLVGGSTALGSSATLVVTNPGATPAEVTIEVFGPSGAVDLAASAGLLVAAGAERALLLEGVAAEQARIAVHVSAAGGLISARVQDSRLDGFTPAGVDLVSAGAAPATRQVVAGLVVGDSELDAPDAAVLRLLAPGGADTTARLSLLGPAGIVTLPGADTVELAGGEVTDLSLGGLPAGAYTAVIDAGEPVVAAAMITRPGLPGELDDGPTLERAWSAATTPGTDGAIARPAQVTGTVVLTGVGAEADGSGTGSADGVLRAIGTEGGILAELPVSVPAGSTTAIPLDSIAPGEAIAGVDLVLAADAGDGSSYEGSSGTVLAWSLLGTITAADGEFVSVLAPVPAAAAPPSVTVRPSRTLGLR